MTPRFISFLTLIIATAHPSKMDLWRTIEGGYEGIMFLYRLRFNATRAQHEDTNMVGPFRSTNDGTLREDS